MAWLSGWTSGYRRKITVDNTNISSDLTNFPILLRLGTSVGQDNDDVSSIFDEVGVDSQKIAITKDDGTTELYAEVEKWDNGSEEAVIWVSKSDLVLSNGSTTDLYFYYDSTHANNTTYIGTTVGSSPATSVWDSDYKAIWHLDESGDGTLDEYVDSTNNGVDAQGGGGTSTKAPSQIAAKIVNGQDFDGSDDYIDVPQNEVDCLNDWTISFWVKQDGLTGSEGWILDSRETDNSTWFDIGTDDSTSPRDIKIYDSTNSWYVSSVTLTDGTWAYITLMADNSAGTVDIYKDGSSGETGISRYDPINSGRIAIGSRYDGGSFYFDGKLDEFRISAKKRDTTWVVADYHNQTDNFVSWGLEGEYKSDSQTETMSLSDSASSQSGVTSTESISLNDDKELNKKTWSGWQTKNTASWSYQDKN